MPQLMPMSWIFSVLMIMFLMVILYKLYFFFCLDLLKFNVEINKMVKWLW